MAANGNLLKEAYEISSNVVQSNEGDLGIFAGGTHFREYWARDSLFTIFGSVYTHPELSKKTIQTFIDYQSEEGQIPLTISENNRWLRVLGFEKPLDEPFYRYDYPLGGKAQDSNLIFILAFEQYIKVSGDIDFLKKNIDSVTKAMEWSNQFEVDGLILEGKITNWMDTLLYSGYNLYTNVLYSAAIRAYAALVDSAGLDVIENNDEKAEKVAYMINRSFWRGEYYSRWAGGDHFSGSGNALALLFEIPGEKKSNLIIDYIERNGISHQPLLEADRKIPFIKRRKGPSIGGMYQYWKHAWPWIGGIYSAALIKNNKALSGEMINKVAQSVVRNSTTMEIIDDKGNRAYSRFYKSEIDFSWSAGTYLYAYNWLTR